ncbi:ABC transporter substrate-binding protein [Marinobacterium jannaschii]|uniref:ABC transporter substrate-binding protein n=1 Tax=Marinobacterium jannaschii TaxID=64970 RepID=UPI001FDFA385|nr:ABC transporter substrate binding protein [Marinobacterium jannaschii]
MSGDKWAVAYYEGGEYKDYKSEFLATIKSLMQRGWIEEKAIPKFDGDSTKELWSWLASSVKSDHLKFLKDGHYSADWSEETREKTRGALINRLSSGEEIDLLISMGTWAGKDTANSKHKVPTLVLSASDPLAAGIIKSVEDSGYSHVHATVDPHRFRRQVEIFHELVQFKKLGVAYENTLSGRSYAAIDDLEGLARDRGFELVSCFTESDISDKNRAEQSVVDCFESLSDSADAIYVTNQGGVNKNSIPKLVGVAILNKVPTFSQSGSDEVKYGFLFSLSRAAYKYLGDFHAKTIEQIIAGAQPGDIAQLFEEPPKIVINLKTAELVGFDPPLLLLGAADEIYREIYAPD